MIDIRQSAPFAAWLRKLKDRQGVARINARLRRLADSGHFGDIKPLRDGVSEMRIDTGPGYRLYFMRRGTVLVVLLAGGDKSTQAADIERAIQVSKEWKD
ncbi:MAG: type II toxin-antitoxin system RelE/ParE family toxin [Rhodocyclaceae bacterium]|jgi:putative addiction module killer protein|nr:type II toxin-antitoxin system RelE/ParE family toxin [Rhodocyclaceae bacterium]